MEFAATAEVQTLIKLGVGVPPESWGRALLPGRFHTARARHVRIPHARARGDSPHSDFT
jgi:hypothetical protein